MNAYEYLQALRAALSALPDDEIDSAMRYYEDYFLDAGDENAAQVIEELGPPEQVAQAILNEYTGVARRRPPHFDEDKAEPVEGVPLGKAGVPAVVDAKAHDPAGAQQLQPRLDGGDRALRPGVDGVVAAGQPAEVKDDAGDGARGGVGGHIGVAVQMHLGDGLVALLGQQGAGALHRLRLDIEGVDPPGLPHQGA